MSGTGIEIAAPGGPAAGSQSRGLAIALVPASYFPQASSLPVGSRLRCKGTMSQDTGAFHRPVAASGGRALSVTVAESALAAPAV